jgi:hypothetical protein
VEDEPKFGRVVAGDARRAASCIRATCLPFYLKAQLIPQSDVPKLPNRF